MKRGRLACLFVLESKQQTSEFYRSIVQGLRAWAPAPPKLPTAALAASPVRVAGGRRHSAETTGNSAKLSSPRDSSKV